MPSLCDQCAALCCRYFALPIDNPTTLKDYDDIRWYLVHENVVAFVEKKQWYIGVLNRCKHLQPDNRCGIYETRPRVCRKYSTDNCEYHGGDYDYEHLFTSAEQLWEFGQRTVAEARAKKRRKVVRNRKRRRVALRLPKLNAGERPLAVSHGSNGTNGNGTVPLTVRGRPATISR
jgi:Fe-S-cluster containining protein